MYSENYDLFDTTYDLDSIMHYPSFSGDSDNASLPVLSLNDDVVFNGTIGQRKCLSYYDIIATNLLYQCNMSSKYVTAALVKKWFGLMSCSRWLCVALVKKWFGLMSCSRWLCVALVKKVVILMTCSRWLDCRCVIVIFDCPVAIDRNFV